MHCRPVLSILLLSTLAATAQASKFSVPEMDIGRLTFRQTSGLDLGSGTGNVELSQLELRSLLSRPIALDNDWLGVALGVTRAKEPPHSCGGSGRTAHE